MVALVPLVVAVVAVARAVLADATPANPLVDVFTLLSSLACSSGSPPVAARRLRSIPLLSVTGWDSTSGAAIVDVVRASRCS
jgi:hypothetical protein